jgi:hypothetical protein
MERFSQIFLDFDHHSIGVHAIAHPPQTARPPSEG